MQSKDHWEQVYTTKASSGVSWFQEHARQSVELIQQTGAAPDSSIIDVGGGASTLVDDLLDGGTGRSRSWIYQRRRWRHRSHVWGISPARFPGWRATSQHLNSLGTPTMFGMTGQYFIS